MGYNSQTLLTSFGLLLIIPSLVLYSKHRLWLASCRQAHGMIILVKPKQVDEHKFEIVKVRYTIDGQTFENFSEQLFAPGEKKVGQQTKILIDSADSNQINLPQTFGKGSAYLALVVLGAVLVAMGMFSIDLNK
jgi:hypothetical protein